MEAVRQVALFDNLFYGFMGIAIIGLVLTVFFFFYFDIPKIFSLITGRNKKKALEQKHERLNSGKSLRTGANTGSTQHRTYVQNSGKMNTNGLTTGDLYTSSEIGGSETSLIGNGETEVIGGGETSVLDQVEDTDVLRPEKAATTVLKASAPSPGVTQDLTMKPKETAVAAPIPVDATFVITEEIVMIHTQEII